ncbi:acetyl-CoA carboxylase biotin carboxyl carrier protein [Clostridium sp. LBM24168]
MIEIDDLDRIMGIIEKHDFSHFEFEHGDSKIVIEKGDSKGEGFKEHNSCSIEGHRDDELHLKNNKSDPKKDYIKSTLAGTFYLRKEKGEEPFVKLHDMVRENTVVGLVEVMKLFNEVDAGIIGEIVDILVKDGDFVEYGQPLFEVKGSEE